MNLFNLFRPYPKSDLKRRGEQKEMQEALKMNVVDVHHIKVTEKVTKAKKVLDHLKKYGSITSWEAIERYKATRLSNIIFGLRQKGLDIETVMFTHTDIYGNQIEFARYYYRE